MLCSLVVGMLDFCPFMVHLRNTFHVLNIHTKKKYCFSVHIFSISVSKFRHDLHLMNTSETPQKIITVRMVPCDPKQLYANAPQQTAMNGMLSKHSLV